MTVFLQVAPLALLIAGVGVIVWRGLRQKPDGKHNKSHYDVGGS